MPQERLTYLLDNIQGLIIPDGNIKLFEPKTQQPTLYYRQLAFMINYIKQINDRGQYFPILGISHGMQLLTNYALGGRKDLYYCGLNDMDQKHPVLKRGIFNRSKFWQKMNQDLVNSVFFKGLYYSHKCGFLVEKVIKEKKNLKQFSIMAVSKNNKGKKFIALVEFKDYPFIGTQFHLEKFQYERGAKYQFISRDFINIKFSHEVIMNFVAPLREQAKNILDVDSWVLGFSSSKLTLRKSGFDSHEQEYIFPRYINDRTIKRTFMEQYNSAKEPNDLKKSQQDNKHKKKSPNKYHKAHKPLTISTTSGNSPSLQDNKEDDQSTRFTREDLALVSKLLICVCGLIAVNIFLLCLLTKSKVIGSSNPEKIIRNGIGIESGNRVEKLYVKGPQDPVKLDKIQYCKN